MSCEINFSHPRQKRHNYNTNSCSTKRIYKSKARKKKRNEEQDYREGMDRTSGVASSDAGTRTST
jgi:hypothetical protein